MPLSQTNHRLLANAEVDSLPYTASPTFDSAQAGLLTSMGTDSSLQPLRLSVLVPVYNEEEVVEESLRRLLSVEHFLISNLEVIVVDDRSTDGTWDILKRLAAEDDRIVLLRNERNLGKGGALRTAIAHATGDVAVPHDADLECNPTDIPALLVPFAKERADAVFGSRFLPGNPYRRVLRKRHTAINKVLTSISNWLTDLNLSDMETCYKAVRTDLLKSIPLRSNDFRFEVEITFKLAKRDVRIFEVPIHYSPRSRAEGKKMRARDGILALICMLRFWLTDDHYVKDELGSPVLSESEARAAL
jgi:glycosyltransferase involved in cell wall biosynthesis